MTAPPPNVLLAWTKAGSEITRLPQANTSNVENTGRGEVILMRCRSGEVLGEVYPTVVQEVFCSLVVALTATDFQKAGSLLNTSA
ncbi:hypothetical protein E2C01_001808 [Portunus trituberculatus]|uniref:Uncharacterized protein n=1 Tax=Portunus trituberculatus TaxID=210409 RepID=A0A5B7CIW2_PORTR|nr:hypothetical protein [Portunus trituberculatus]